MIILAALFIATFVVTTLAAFSSRPYTMGEWENEMEKD